MRIEAFTNKGQQLVDAINKKIDEEILKTWKRVENDKNETLYTHKPKQWNDEALLKPKLTTDRVTFTVKWWKNKDEPTHDVKGYITGRFTEILLVHFHEHFTKLETYG